MAVKKKSARTEKDKAMSKWGRFKKRYLTPIPWWLPAVVLVIIVLVGLVYTRGWLFAAKVNGRFVSRLELASRLEQMYGKQVLDNLVVEKLIEQEALEKNLQVTGEEIDKQVEEIAKQVAGEDLDKLLAAQGMTRQQLREQVRLNLLVEKLVEDKVEIGDEEIDKYVEQNKEFLDEGGDVREQARMQLKQTKMGEEVQNLIQELRDAAAVVKYI